MRATVQVVGAIGRSAKAIGNSRRKTAFLVIELFSSLYLSLLLPPPIGPIYRARLNRGHQVL